MADAARDRLGVREDSMDSDLKMTSDIAQTWQDPNAISQDIRAFLVQEYQRNMGEDYHVEDIVKAIEQGVQEFRKITNV